MFYDVYTSFFKFNFNTNGNMLCFIFFHLFLIQNGNVPHTIISKAAMNALILSITHENVSVRQNPRSILTESKEMGVT